jgi:hypothetical protein
MRDPSRIIEGSSDDVAVRLMKSVQHDAPSAQARVRTLAALSLPATLSVVGKAAAATALLTSKGIVIGVFAGVVMGSTLATLAVGLSKPTHPAQAVAQPAQRAAESKWVQDKSKAESQAVVAPAEPALTPLASVASSPAATDHARAIERPATGATDGERPASQLSREVAALDTVRTAALAHQPERVLALLDAYQREFPQCALGPEAQVLRVEALARSGRLNQARVLAQKLLANDPSGPLSHRIRAAAPNSDAHDAPTTNFRSNPGAGVISR